MGITTPQKQQQTQDTKMEYPLGKARTQQIAGRAADIWSPMFFGSDPTSPTARRVAGATRQEAGRAGAEVRTQLAEQPGLTEPAYAALADKLQALQVSAAAGVPMQLQALSYEELKNLLQPSGQTTTVRGSGSGGAKYGICWIWTFFNGEHGEDTEIVREYRNKHFGKYSSTDIGYREMGKLTLPLMSRSKLIQKLVYLTVYKPCTAIAKGSHNPIDLALSRFWLFVWRTIGNCVLRHDLICFT